MWHFGKSIQEGVVTLTEKYCALEDKVKALEDLNDSPVQQEERMSTEDAAREAAEQMENQNNQKTDVGVQHSSRHPAAGAPRHAV